MGYGDTWDQGSLDTLFGLSTYTPPSTGCLSLHLAPTLETDASISDTTAVIGYQPENGSKMTFKPRDTAEVHYSGSVTDNGDGTYTVELENSSGLTSSISAGFVQGNYVEVTPAESEDRINEPPLSTGYSRYEYPLGSSGWTRSGSEVTNDTGAKIGPASADWGLVTHTVLMSAETSGNLLFSAKASKYKVYSDYDGYEIYSGMLTITQD